MRSVIVPAAMLVLLFGGTAQAGSLRVIHDFCAQALCTDGDAPNGNLVIDPQGNVYGTAEGGGAPQHGLVYELKRGHGKQFTFETLYTFCTEDGCPDGYQAEGVIRDTSGNLYGMTEGGGTSNDGTAYMLTPRHGGAWKYTKLKIFNGNDGDLPIGTFGYAGSESGLPYDGTSPLYGTTVSGGTSPTGGTVFTITPDGGHWTFQTIFNFTAQGDANEDPAGTPVLDASGNLFGTTLVNGNLGEVYELSPDGGGGWNEHIVYTFCGGCNDNTAGAGELAMDASGSLIGITSYFGPYCSGHGLHTVRCGGGVFKLAPDGANWDYTALYDFCAKSKKCSDGSEDMIFPPAPVIDAFGNIYGTTRRGGKYGSGVLFRIGTDGSYEVVHNFCAQAGCADGKTPDHLVMAADGSLYGNTVEGGASNGGTVFEFTP
ncbi:MAG TPA: choice-of-anchor tandem repeat GloVer-containing protein [Rhizomicrobium sp.]|nr:choice-of-anchor tandem repeat GloVer-containing protein [Rhizomicrobium sp.]